MKKNIPIVLASDNNYAKYLNVTLTSILSNAKKDTFYDIYLLITPDFSDKNIDLILSDASRHNNNKINFIKFDKNFASEYKLLYHTAKPTFYRLKIAEILPSIYDKWLYFDTDVIVNIDLQEYYNIDLKNNIVAGVYDCGIMDKEFEKFSPNHKKTISVPD